ncbi:hypothetical protein V6N11_058796 [Hibiscus sabdariffa]|uniref:RNase H type-1 domain-containing protein n=1 Tax=Hibiscus sabdariffa TaxID=183260 RepID=A0ABR2U5G0_9ROSI
MLSVFTVGSLLIRLALVVAAIMSLSSIFCVTTLPLDAYGSPLSHLWKRRNDFIFTGNCLPLSDIYRIGFAWAAYFADATFEQSSTLQPRFDSFQWQRPPHDCLCLNVDVVVSFPARLGTIGGVLWDSSKVQFDSSVVVRLVLDPMASTSTSHLVHNRCLAVHHPTIGFVWVAYFADAAFVQSSTLQPRFDSFQWQALSRDCLCLNTDDDVSFHACLGTIGGVLRDSSGVWVKGFCKSIGIISPLQAELWSILVGLQLAWSMGISLLQVQSDSSVVVCLVLDPMASTSTSPLVRAIAMLSNRDWSITFI